MISYLEHHTGKKRQKTSFSGNIFFFEARYLVNRAFYEKSDLDHAETIFCVLSENRIRKGLRATESAFLEHFSFFKKHLFPG